jgi:hypothetical protein
LEHVTFNLTDTLSSLPQYLCCASNKKQGESEKERRERERERKGQQK